jgi:hypothetical protein
MSTPPSGSEHAQRAARIYGAAADHFSRPALGFWDIVLGSGYRATADALSPAQQAQVRDRVVTELRSRSVAAITTNVVHGTATKPAKF